MINSLNILNKINRINGSGGRNIVQHSFSDATLTAVPASNTAINLEFAYPSSEDFPYSNVKAKIYYRVTGTTGWSLATYITDGVTTTYQKTGLTQGTSYDFMVRFVSGSVISSVGRVVTNASFLSGESFDNGKIVLQFDDAWDSVYDYGLPLFQEKEIVVTTAANAYLIDHNTAHNGFYKMTWDELNLFKAAGCDVQCHGWKGNDLTLLTDEQIEQEYVTNTARFIANGLPSPLHTIYSGGYCNYRTIQQTGLYRLTGRRLRNNKTLDRYSSKLMMSCAVITLPTEDLKILIDEAAEEKKALVLYGHMIGVDDNLSVTVSKLEELIDYAKSKNIDFLTIPELYDLMFYINIDLYREGLNDDEIGVIWSSKLDESYSYSLERSTDGINFTEVHESNPGEKYYLDSGLSAGTNYYYRVRAFKGEDYLPYSGIEYLSTPVTLTLTSRGTGAEVSTLIVLTEYDSILTVDGNGHFYTDKAGTTGETQTWSLYRDTVYTIYIKCTSGTANLVFNSNYLKKFEGWSTTTNSPSLSGDISIFKRIYYLKLTGANTLSGDIANYPALSYLQMSTDCSGLTKDVTSLTKLRYIYTSGTGAQITGTITNLLKLYYLKLLSTDSITGDISNLVLLTQLNITSAAASIGGSISELTKLTYLIVSGANTLSGTFEKLTLLEGSVNIGAGNAISGDLSDIADGITSLYLGNGSLIGGSVSGLSSNIKSITVNSTEATITGTVAQLPRQLTYIAIIGNTLTGDISDLPPDLTTLTLKGNNTVIGDLATLPSSLHTFNIQNSKAAIEEYTSPHSWTALRLFYYYPYNVSISVSEASNLIIDMSAASWSGSKLLHIQPNIAFSMVDTEQGGMWGDYSDSPIPSTLATALKTLVKTKKVAVAIKSLTLPGATGDGTGFPAGFGDWYRS